ncbi:MAG: DUF1292 domain-containing protein [Clostridia bacterium]|nr:DUF1292 domain-containing protein [Clostridia bacterium]
MALDFEPEEYYTLVDDDGVETEFALRLRAEFEGHEYFALVPAEPNPDFEEGDFIILRLESVSDSNEATLVNIEDDDEFDRVADFFEDLLYGGEINYDESSDTSDT